MKEISISKNEIAEKKNEVSNLLSEKFSLSRLREIEQVSLFFSTAINTLNEIKDNIDPEEAYIIKFSKEQLEKFKNGDINFQQKADKSGNLPTFVKKGTNNDFDSHPLVEKMVLSDPVAFQQVLVNINQLAISEKIAGLENLMNDIKQANLELMQGQKDDRRAKILGAEETINQALTMPDSNPQKEILLLNSINQLNEGRASLISEFKNEIKKQISIPNSGIKLFFKSVFNDKFNDEVSNSFLELNNQFSYIVKSTDLLAKIYSITGNSHIIETIYDPLKILIEENKGYISKLVELNEPTNDIEKRQMKWCIEPEEFVTQLEYVKFHEDDIVTIEFTGEELLNGQKTDS